MRSGPILSILVAASWLLYPASSLALDTSEIEARLERAFTILNEFRGNTAVLDSARKELDAILAADPSYAPAYREYARYFIMAGAHGGHFEQTHLQAAEAALNRALEIDPDYADAFVLFGHLYFLMDRNTEAKRALAKAEALGSKSPWLHINWAAILFDEGKVAAANTRYKTVLDSNTDNFKAIRSARWGLVRGQMWRAQTLLNEYNGKESVLDAAKAELDAALSTEPNVARLHSLIAHYWLLRGFDETTGFDRDALENAERSLKTAIGLEPMFGDAQLRLAHVYILMRRPNDAKSALESAVANGNKSPLVDAYLAEIAQLENLVNKTMH
jgi:Tfp pilus assembly protein PilF